MGEETRAVAVGLQNTGDVPVATVAAAVFEIAEFGARVEVQRVEAQEKAAATFGVRVGRDGLGRLQCESHANAIVECLVRKAEVVAAYVQVGPEHGAWVAEGEEVGFVEGRSGFLEQAFQKGVLVCTVQVVLEVTGDGRGIRYVELHKLVEVAGQTITDLVLRGLVKARSEGLGAPETVVEGRKSEEGRWRSGVIRRQ